MAKKLFDEIVTIRENRQVNAKYRKLVFVSPELSRHVLPGQFLHVKVDPGRDPYLRRPFSYYRTQKNTVEILYEVLGHGTEVLSQKNKGDFLKIMGPLGNCFKADLKGKKRICRRRNWCSSSYQSGGAFSLGVSFNGHKIFS